MMSKESPNEISRSKYLGSKHINNQGCSLTVIEYTKYRKVKIQFENGHIRVAGMKEVFEGSIMNPFHRTAYAIGYIGVGRHKTTYKGKPTKAYDKWVGMLRRCYSEEERKKYPTYENISVCEKWKCFQNFADWFEINYREGLHLDKDIKIKGNEVYSPEACIFVPQIINGLFTKTSKKDGLPMGVYLTKAGNYTVSIRIAGKGQSLGTYPTIEKAFKIYKEAKEKEIKRAIKDCKEIVDPEVYEIVYNYKL